MDPITIRDATPQDVLPLAELSNQLGYPSSFLQVSTRLGPILCSKEHAVLVAALPDGAVVGWIHVFAALRIESDPFAELGGFVVAEKHRGRGVGKQLLRAAEEWAAQNDVAKLRVRSRSDRHDAINFYEAREFAKKKEQTVLDKTLTVRIADRKDV